VLEGGVSLQILGSYQHTVPQAGMCQPPCASHRHGGWLASPLCVWCLDLILSQRDT
jgi:hypothetical protein